MNKTRSKCVTEKPTSDFYGDVSRADGLQVYCKSCDNEARRRWARTNAHKTSATTAAWRKSHPGRSAAISARWSKRYPHKAAANSSRRRARKRGNAVADTTSMIAFRKRVNTTPRMRCYYCRTWVPKGSRTVDHIWPIAKGGPDAEWNLCCACIHCNSTKHAKDPGLFTGQYELILLPERKIA